MRLIRRLFPVLALLGIAGCGSPSSTTPASPSASPSAATAESAAAPKVAATNDWKAPPEATAQLGAAVKILGGRFSVQASVGFTAADGPGTFVYMAARGEPQELEALEACVLSFKK